MQKQPVANALAIFEEVKSKINGEEDKDNIKKKNKENEEQQEVALCCMASSLIQ